MPVKVTLIHAGISGIGFDSFGKSDDLLESTWINHGLCYVSAMAKKSGHSVDLIDLRKIKGWEGLKREISQKKPLVVGLSMMSVDYDYVMKCVDVVKKTDRNIRVVVGGPHPSMMLDEVSSNGKIDHIITGEGEISFAALLTDIDNGRNDIPRIIPGIRPDLNEIPFADRELYSHREYSLGSDFPEPFVTTITSRGCIYNCSFCQPSERLIFGKQVRYRTADNIMSELRQLRDKYDFKSLMIHDDCFTQYAKRAGEFCDKYRANGFDQPFICQTRADIICKNEDLVREMRDTGLRMFIIGFESGNQRILNFLRKGTTVEQNLEAASICRKLGIKIWANYMVGIPTETQEEVMDTVRMIKEIKPDHYSPAFYTPHPGSDLFDFCMENDISLVTSHDEYRRNTFGRKIKGVDYAFLNQAVNESLGIRPDEKGIRKAIRIVKRYKAGKLLIHGLRRITGRSRKTGTKQ